MHPSFSVGLGYNVLYRFSEQLYISKEMVQDLGQVCPGSEFKLASSVNWKHDFIVVPPSA